MHGYLGRSSVLVSVEFSGRQEEKHSLRSRIIVDICSTASLHELPQFELVPLSILKFLPRLPRRKTEVTVTSQSYSNALTF